MYLPYEQFSVPLIVYIVRSFTHSFVCRSTVTNIFFISVINQLEAQYFCFIISLFDASTCFEHMCSSSGGQNVNTQYCVLSFFFLVLFVLSFFHFPSVLLIIFLPILRQGHHHNYHLFSFLLLSFQSAAFYV